MVVVVLVIVVVELVSRSSSSSISSSSMQILLPKDARSTDILPDSGQTKDPAMWTGISLEHFSAQYIYIFMYTVYK